MRIAEEKVPDGKLVKVSIAQNGQIRITGDFFIHPEESITLIENALCQLDANIPAPDIERLLGNLIMDGNIELIGIDVPAIVRLYQRCLTCGE